MSAASFALSLLGIVFFVGCAAVLGVDADPIVDGGASSTDGGTGSESSSDSSPPTNPKRVFVTKKVWNADLQLEGKSTSGSGGADALCAEAAAIANLGGGPWNAWIREGDTLVEADRVKGLGQRVAFTDQRIPRTTAEVCDR